MRYQAWEFGCRYPNDLFAEIVKSRSIKNLDEFINIDYKNLVSTKKLKNISEAVARIKRSIDNNKKIGIFCDYDADGVCSGAIIYRAIKQLGGYAITIVPERRQGYSVNDEAVKEFIDASVDLVITLDCGIKNHKQIDRLLEDGIETIVIDHHQLPDELPNAIAIVHPDLTHDGNSLELSGGGTAYMVARELLGESGQEKWLIDLAAISSVADIVPFNHDNRILVQYGMNVLSKTKNLGLKTLLKTSSLDAKPLTTYDLGFGIAPRLNAAGRIAHPRDSYDLLTTEDPKMAQVLARKLDKFNATRQDMLAKGIEQAVKIVEQNKLEQEKIIVIDGPWDEGIVGLIASRITDKYYRPSIVLSNNGEFLKGSARSIEGINITNAIGECESWLMSFGGHAQAAGLSLEKTSLSNFKKSMIIQANKFDKKAYQRKLKVDALIKPDQITVKNIQKLDKLAPFGPGNPKPIFCLENIKVESVDVIGRDKSHQKITYSCEQTDGCLLVFSYEKKEIGFEVGKKFDIVFTAGINEFRGNKKIDLFLEDAKEIK